MQRVKDILSSDKSITYLFYGDSITHGVLHTFGARDYTQLFTERVRCELERGMDIVVNSAISGNTTVDLLRDFKWRCERFSPDVVFLMIGMNDCSVDNHVSIENFKSNLQELVKRFLSINALCILQTTCPILSNTSPDREPYFESYMQIVREIADEFDLPLIDHTKHWQQRAKDNYLLMSDPFHPNKYGHRLFAKYIYQLLDIYDANSHTCNLFIP